MRSFSILLLAAVVLVSCGDKNKKKSSSTQNGVEIIAEGLTKEQATRIAKAGEQECLDPSRCSPSVAFITFIDKQPKNNYMVGVCSGTLVGPDLLLTNSHCIPQHLKAAGPNADCRGQMWFNFVRDDGNPQLETQLGCAKLLYASALTVAGADEVDYALVQLDGASRRPFLRTNRLGLEKNSIFSLYKVNPPGEDEERVLGHQQFTLCRIVHESMMQQDNYDQFGRTTMFSDCAIMGGNSGSAIIDDAGEIRGVIQSHVVNAELLSLQLNNMGFYLSERFTDEINMGTNFACVDLDRVNNHLPKSPACSNRTTLDRINEGRIEVAAQGYMGELPRRLRNAFEWKLRAFEDKTEEGRALGVVKHVPTCLREGAALPESFATNVPSMPFALGVDRFVRLVFQPAAAQSGEELMGFTVTPAANGSTKVTMTIVNTGKEIHSTEIPRCGAAL